MEEAFRVKHQIEGEGVLQKNKKKTFVTDAFFLNILYKDALHHRCFNGEFAKMFQKSFYLNHLSVSISRGVFKILSGIYGEVFTKTVKDWKLLIIFAKRSILEAGQGSEYASAFRGD